jgi:two-component system, OmpR family, response regulator
MKKKVLIIEDDFDIANLVKLQLLDLNCEVSIADDGLKGLDLFRKKHFDLLVLDIMLPGIDGLDVCKAIRAMESYVPILMLTAKSSELDRVLGLELGADDYLTKPFSILEFAARVKALFRRVEAMQAKSNKDQQDSQEQLLTFGEIEINTRSRSVNVRGEIMTLTAKEFDLLAFFTRHPGQVFTRTQLLDKVWGYGHDGYEHTVNSHINRLRAKIEKSPAKPDYILTAWGVGYKFTENF